MTQWYYAPNNQQTGPIEEAELINKFTSGELPPTTMVWAAGMSQWVAANASELATKITVAPQPAAPARTPAQPGAPRSSNASTAQNNRIQRQNSKLAAIGDKNRPARNENQSNNENEDGYMDFGESTSPTAGNKIFVPISITKFIILSFCCFGYYELYWFYKNWEFLKEERGEDIYPAVRAIFTVIYAFSLASKVSDELKDKGVSSVFPPTASMILFIVMVLAVRFSHNLFIILICSLAFITLIPVQMSINKLNEGKSEPDSSFSGGLIAVCVILGLARLGFLGLAILGGLIQLTAHR